MNTHFSLPGIKSIAVASANVLPSELAMQSLAGLPISAPSTAEDIPFHGETTCECTQTYAPALSETVELTFSSLVELPSDTHIAILVTDANCIPYLIGTKEEHPAIERRQTFGNPDSDSNIYTYTIRMSAPRALIRCVIR